MNIISLCDFTGVFVDPWSKTHKCYIFDIQHPEFKEVRPNVFTVPGKIEDNLSFINSIMEEGISFASGFPPCTDLAVSGAAHFENKRKDNPRFQEEAMELFLLCYNICKSTKAPFLIENPVSVAATMFRKPCFTFHPWEYGGYLPVDDKNPISDLIPPRDAYPKKTCLWTGNGFDMPIKRPVNKPEGYSPQHTKLGGKSLKTKNIRSATPRGFARAVYEKYAALE